MQKEGGREKRRKRWRKSSLFGDVRLDQCIVNSFSWPFCSHPRCLALRSDDHTNSLGSLETQVCGEKFHCNHWTPFPGCLGKSLQWCLRKKCSWLGPFDSLSFLGFFFFSWHSASSVQDIISEVCILDWGNADRLFWFSFSLCSS